MAIVQVGDLIEAGVHFGHKASRWDPKMRPFIYGKRNLIHIIDLRETVRGLLRAYRYLAHVASQGSLILFVGTKRQAKEVIERESTRCHMPYVSERWLGGTLRMIPGQEGTQPKDVPLEAFFKKIIGVREKLRVLEQKGHVRHEERGRQFVYSPAVPRRTARRSALRHVVDTFFDGSVEQVVAALLGGCLLFIGLAVLFVWLGARTLRAESGLFEGSLAQLGEDTRRARGAP